MGKWPKLDKIDDDRRSDRRRRLRAQAEEAAARAARPAGSPHAHRRTGRGRVDGWDAAGKGGLIQRLIFGLEPRSHPCLADRRADRRGEEPALSLALLDSACPSRGNWAVFDRTWYGRVLVERIEGFCTKDEWKRAYREINEFERHAGRRRRAHRQAARPCQRGGAAPAHDQAAGRPAQALQGRPRGLPQHRQAQAVSRSL